MHKNSLEAYDAIEESLPNARKRVYSVIKQRGRVTRQGIAMSLNKPINEVTGRVRELLDADLIAEDGDFKSVKGRKRAVLVVKLPPEGGKSVDG